jgi:hypothetical protein
VLSEKIGIFAQFQSYVNHGNWFLIANMKSVMTEEQWQWQEPGTAWRGVCTYHITLTVPSLNVFLASIEV